MIDNIDIKQNKDNDLYNTINKYLSDFQYELAESIITEYINLDPDNLNHRFKRIEIITAMDNDYIHYSNGSVDKFDEFLYPRKVVHYDLLATDYTKLIESKKNAYLYAGRAYAFKCLNLEELEINDLKSAISLKTDFFKCYFDLARIYQNKNDYQNALYYYSQAIDKIPSNTILNNSENPFIERSLIYEKMKDYKSALNDLKQTQNRQDHLYNNDYERIIKYCYLIKDYDECFSFARQNSLNDFFLIPYVYKKLGHKNLEVKYYKNLIDREYRYVFYAKHRLQAYKRLMVLLNKKHPHPILRLRYVLDKHVFCRIFKDFDVIY